MVYIMNRDASSRLTISSPLEAHKASTIVFDTCGLDVNFDNPVFAVIELDYAEADQARERESERASGHLTRERPRSPRRAPRSVWRPAARAVQ